MKPPYHSVTSAPDRAATLTLGELKVGMMASFDVHIGEHDIDRFAAASGDLNPLHMDACFARSRRFQGRVVHGAYFAGLASRLVGMYLPGRDCLLQTVQMKFHSPACAETEVRVMGEVDQVSEAVRSAVVKITIRAIPDGTLVASGKITTGFTEESSDD
jgi:3-hydroxybutyryl-CoA dehydratase